MNNSEDKPEKLRLKTDFVLTYTDAEGLGRFIIIR